MTKNVRKQTQQDVSHEQRKQELQAWANLEPAALCPKCDGFGVDGYGFICRECQGTGNQPEEYFHE